MIYNTCINNIKNGFFTGCILSIIFIFHESYILTFFIGICIGIELNNIKLTNLKKKIKPNTSTITQINLDTSAICIQKYCRRYLVRLGNKIYYPYYLEWSISCKWQSISQDIDLPNIINNKRDIIRLEKKYHHLVQQNEIDTELYPNIWLVEIPKHLLSRYSVLLPIKYCRKKNDNCRKCTIFRKYKNNFEQYTHQNPDYIKKIKRGDLLIGYQKTNGIKYLMYSKAKSNAINPLYPSINII
jgi:hypothetical protein